MPQTETFAVNGAGLGLRRGFINHFLEADPQTTSKTVNFLEVAPENWIQMGGSFREKFEKIAEHYPITAHGLSLSIGGPTPLDTNFIADVKEFLDRFNIKFYSDHLSSCSDDGHLYDLMPIPFTEEAVHYVAGRIRQVQDQLERRIAIENVSFYAMQTTELDEITFTKAILEEANCDLHLDVNNAYVNSVNHKAYSAEEFIRAMPAERVKMIHVAGHFNEAEDLLVDTHGTNVIPSVWKALEIAYSHCGNTPPTLLERDFNFPPLQEMIDEVGMIQTIQKQYKHA